MYVNIDIRDRDRKQSNKSEKQGDNQTDRQTDRLHRMGEYYKLTYQSSRNNASKKTFERDFTNI